MSFPAAPLPLETFAFDADQLERIRREFSRLGEITPFAAAPGLASAVASFGIAREVGTVNDETARFIFAAN